VNEPKVVIAMSIWDDLKARTHYDLIRVLNTGIIAGYCQCVGSLLPSTRNEAVRQVYENYMDFTHILFIDGDMCGFDGTTVDVLISANKPIVSPLMSRRQPPYQPCIPENSLRDLAMQLQKPIDKRKVLKVPSTGMGFTLVKREVIESTCEVIAGASKDDGPRQAIWFTGDRNIRENFFDVEVPTALKELQVREWTDDENELEVGFEEGVKLGLNARMGAPVFGEDFVFCSRAAVAGHETYIDPTIMVLHIGEQAYGVHDWMDWAVNKHNIIGNRLEHGVSMWKRKDPEKNNSRPPKIIRAGRG